MRIHHKDNNGLNNIPNNIEIITHNLNIRLGRKLESNNNGLPNCVYEYDGRFCATFNKNRKKIYLGTFATPEEAEQAIIKYKVTEGIFVENNAE